MHYITFYPVGNGDSSQIKLESGRRMLFDYRQHANAGTDECAAIDLAKQLRQELKDDKRDYFEVLAFTHGDRDHYEGSTEFFWFEHAAKYQGDGRIKFNEMWVPAAMILEEFERDTDPGELRILRQEARYRLRQGKGIRVFSRPDRLKDWLEKQGLTLESRRHLITDAGQVVTGYSLDVDGVEFFCHSPFVKHCEGKDILRNEASLIFQVRFKVWGTITNYFAVGDSEHSVLDDIVEISKYHGNEDRLDWNLFKTPHHNSYLALGPDKGDKETEPTAGVKDLLEHGQEGAYMVSSCWPIGNDKEAYESIQPPHVQAKNTYKKYLNKVEGRELLVTMEEPNTKKPQPMIFEVMHAGLRWAQAVASGASFLTSTKPPRAGRK